MAVTSLYWRQFVAYLLRQRKIRRIKRAIVHARTNRARLGRRRAQNLLRPLPARIGSPTRRYRYW